MSTLCRIPLTVERLQEYIREFDLVIRPKALVVSPEMEEALLKAEPDIEKKLVVVTSLGMDNTAYLIDRTELEHMGRYTTEGEDK